MIAINVIVVSIDVLRFPLDRLYLTIFFVFFSNFFFFNYFSIVYLFACTNIQARTRTTALRLYEKDYTFDQRIN